MADRSYRTFARRVVAGTFLCWFIASAASAQTLTFEDQTLGTQYAHGDRFITDGVEVTFGTYFFRDGTPTLSGSATILNGQQTGGSGKELWITNVNASFGFQELTSLSLRRASLRPPPIVDTERVRLT